jgi:hypothetical protein
MDQPQKWSRLKPVHLKPLPQNTRHFIYMHQAEQIYLSTATFLSFFSHFQDFKKP